MGQAGTDASFALEDLTPTIGSIVHGVDLSRPLSDGATAALREALLDRQVLFLRDQDISAADQLRFAGIFGTPQEAQNMYFGPSADNKFVEVLESKGRASGTDVWHSDKSYVERPNAMTCLHAQELPPCGGDTLWASMTAAYDGLSSETKALIDDLQAVHDWEKGLGEKVRADRGEERYLERRERYAPVLHPVVKTHPDTGRKLVYVNDLYTWRIVGVPEELGKALLSYLTQLPKTPEYQIRFKWEPNSLAIWDNRAVQHYAVGDYNPHIRRMHRITLMDD